MAIYRGIGGAGDSNTDAAIADVTEQAVLAFNSATGAALSASNAAGSASTSDNRATASANSATASANSATTSGNSATASANSAAESAASYDSFDDRYLGPKSTAPTTNNDGDALITGALYFDTVDESMKVWDSSAWLDAYASLSIALIKTNNLSDLLNVGAARTNLGLGTVATTALTDYATAAQGALADTAVQPAAIGTAAAEDVGFFATAAQGALAATATQPADLATVATTGAYTDLTGTPTLGTAAATASTDYATAAQGTLADTALQTTSTIDGGSY